MVPSRLTIRLGVCPTPHLIRSDKRHLSVNPWEDQTCFNTSHWNNRALGTGQRQKTFWIWLKHRLEVFNRPKKIVLLSDLQQMKAICSGRGWSFPTLVESHFQEIQRPLVVTSSRCFAQVRPSSSLSCTMCSQFMPSFPDNPFHKQHPAFACCYERKGLGNSGCMIALPWSQQLVISASYHKYSALFIVVGWL